MQTEGLLKRLLNSSTDIIICFNNSMDILQMSKEAKRLFEFNKNSSNEKLLNVLKKHHINLNISPYINPSFQRKKIKFPLTKLTTKNSIFTISWELSLPSENAHEKIYLLIGKHIIENNDTTISKRLEKENFSNAALLNEISREIIGSDLFSTSKTSHHDFLLYFLQNIITDMPGNVYWKDKNSIYLGCNNNIAKIANLSSRFEIIGKDDFYFEKKLHWPSGTAVRFRQDDTEVIKSKNPKTFEDIYVQSDGKEVVMLTTKKPVFGADNKVIGILATSMDITQLKQQEADLKKAKEAAEQMNKTKTEFLANMSHDLKTPLAGIMAGAETLLTSITDPKERESLNDIRDCGRNLMLFFDNCLELSKLENADVTIIMERFSLQETLTQVTALFKPAMTSKHLTMQVKYDAKIPPFLMGSKPAVYRILQNLIGNAIKFTSKGFVNVSVELVEKNTDGEAIVKLEVSDSGMGIPQDKQRAIFERLTRLTPSHQGVYEGSGIGLYLVEKFTKAMNGEVYVESELGKGSIFTVVLPLHIASVTEDTQTSVHTIAQPEEDEAQWRGIFSQEKFRVLLVEDNKMAQKTARILLEVAGCEVDSADNGTQAIALFQPGKYSIVYMDIGLPDMPGYKAAKILREHEAGTHFSVPILALSAHVNVSEKSACFEAGINAILSKPLLMKKTVRSIEKFVQHKDVIVEGLTDQTSTTTESAQPESKRIIDIEEGQKIANGKREQAIEIIADLVASIPKERQDIQTLFETGDIEKLTKIVHRFHGGLCCAGLPRLREAAKRFQIALKDHDSEKFYPLYQDVLNEMEAAKNEFKILKL